MARHDFRGTRCLVTGASSGIGRAIARALARQGARVVLTGRNAERLEAVVSALVGEGVAPDALLAVPADLRDVSNRARLFEAVTRFHAEALDIVFNAAGVGVYGRFESHDERALRDIFEINVFALAEVCRASLPLLRRGERPAVVNIGSIIARRALPGRSEYSASKHAVAALTDSIRAEWKIDGIHVLLVNPGFTATSFEENVLVDTAIYKTAHRRTARPEDVAEATLRALSRRKNEVTLTFPGRLLLRVNRLWPRFVDWGLARWTVRLYSDNEALLRAETRDGQGTSTNSGRARR